MSNPKPQQIAKDMWKATADALLSDDEVEAIYDRLSGLAVALDDDPLAYGPKRLQEQVAMCRKHLSETERIYLEVSKRLHKLNRELRAKKSALELSTKYLYAEDPEVRAGRNIADRDAFAAIKLKEEWMEVHGCEQKVSDMGAVLYVIKAKRSDLRDTQGRLRDQVRLCGQELELGGRWGTKRPNAPELQPGQGRAVGTDVDDVLDLIEEVGGAVEVNLDYLEAEETQDEEPIKENAKISTVAPAPVTEKSGERSLLPENNALSAAEALPSNGTTGAEIDKMLARVPNPTKMVGGKTVIVDQDIDSLLEMFE